MECTVKEYARYAYSLGRSYDAIITLVKERGHSVAKSTLSQWKNNGDWKRLPKSKRTKVKETYLLKTMQIVDVKMPFPLPLTGTHNSIKHGIQLRKDVRHKIADELVGQGGSCASHTYMVNVSNERQAALEDESPDIRAINADIAGYDRDLITYEWLLGLKRQAIEANGGASEILRLIEVSTTSKGINAGKKVDLKDFKVEKEHIEVARDIQRMIDNIAKIRRLRAQCVKDRAIIKDMEARRATGATDNETAATFTDALSKIANKVQSGELSLDEVKTE